MKLNFKESDSTFEMNGKRARCALSLFARAFFNYTKSAPLILLTLKKCLLFLSSLKYINKYAELYWIRICIYLLCQSN